VEGWNSPLADGEIKHGDEVVGEEKAPSLSLDGKEDAVERLKERVGGFAQPIGEDARETF
jgi:hypothetical protein